MRERLNDELQKYKQDHHVSTKGRLSQVIVLTRRARSLKFPIDFDTLKTRQGGQISGASGDAANKILREHGITRRLSSEGGRTSRGSIGYANEYVDLLNRFYREGWLGNKTEQLDSALMEIEVFWVEQVRSYFNSTPIVTSLDMSQSIGQIVSSVLAAARERQQELGGAMIVGTVLQHLVGAKLVLSLQGVNIEHHSASTSDDQSGRSGDFLIQDSVIHVTITPGEKLIAKCADNLKNNLRPIVVCPFDKVEAARQLAENAAIADRIEVYDAQAFISMNLNELSLFRSSALGNNTRRFVEQYNELIQKYESDPSLCLQLK